MVDWGRGARKSGRKGFRWNFGRGWLVHYLDSGDGFTGKNLYVKHKIEHFMCSQFYVKYTSIKLFKKKKVLLRPSHQWVYCPFQLPYINMYVFLIPSTMRVCRRLLNQCFWLDCALYFLLVRWNLPGRSVSICTADNVTGDSWYLTWRWNESWAPAHGIWASLLGVMCWLYIIVCVCVITCVCVCVRSRVCDHVCVCVIT